MPKPKLAFFFDEAHLLFKDASEALLEQIERTARLIRSKGVGVYFVTQAPTDVPSSVLSQLGNRIQHALRAFTPDDADALRKASRTFPVTTHYDVERTITSLGIGEALVTVLSPKGVPTPLAATRLIPPDSRMAPLTEPELAQLAGASQLNARYGTTVDRESAHEIITARLAAAHQAAAAAAGVPRWRRRPRPAHRRHDPGPVRARDQAPGAQQAERDRQREMREAERDRKAQERERKAAERERQRTINTGVRTAGRVITSRVGQSLIRGVFDTIFGRRSLTRSRSPRTMLTHRARRPSMTLTATQPHKIYLAGSWVDSPDTLVVDNPADPATPAGATYNATEAQYEEAVTAAVAAFEHTKVLPAYERGRALREISNGIKARREEIGRILSLEAGKPIRDALVEVDRAVLTFRLGAEEAERMYGETIPLDLLPSSKGRMGITRRFPIGPGRGDQPVQLPAQPRRAQAGAGDRRGLLDRAQAAVEGPADDAHRRRDRRRRRACPRARSASCR